MNIYKKITAFVLLFFYSFGILAAPLSQSSFSPNSQNLQKPLKNSAISPDQTLTLSNGELGWGGPLAIGINYDRLTGVFGNAKYTHMLNNNFAFSALGEYGANMYRVSGTIGSQIFPKTFAKLSVERLSQVLPFTFTTGDVNQRVGQNAVGVGLQQDILNPIFRNINYGGYYAHSENVNLTPLAFISNGGNCGDSVGLLCIDYRHIAGASAGGAYVGTSVYVTPATGLSGKIYYDNVSYDTRYSSHDNEQGIGASVQVNQIINEHLKVFGGAEVRKIYSAYNGGIAWLPPLPTKLNLEFTATGQEVISRNNVPNSTSVGVGVTFNLDGTGQPTHYMLSEDSSITNLEAWVSEPAVYMDRVLAKAEEKIVLLTSRVSGLFPSFGPVVGGNIVTISGSNLISGTIVYFGNQIATTTSLSGNKILVVAPPGSAGSTSVTIQPPDQSAIVLTNAYTYVDPLAPHISSDSPSSGSTTGGTVVTITGTNLNGTTSVTFGGVPGTGITVVNNTTVTVTAPAHVAGSVNVVVTTPEGSSTLSNGFTYQGAPIVSAIAPTSGTTAGGTSVTITGTNLLGTTGVTFGGLAASNVTVVNPTTVRVATPAHAVGPVDVILTTNVNSTTVTNGFTYTAAPILTSISPTTGTTSGGTSVTFTGENLTGTTAVTFGGLAATNVTVVNSTTVTATTPAHAMGSVDVTITTPSGLATLSSAYLYQGVPSLSAITPTLGTVAGGTGVTLTGANLAGTTAVTLGGTAATQVNVVNNTTVTAITPGHVAGLVDVAATTPIASATLPSAYLYITAPTLTSLLPTSGPTTGGTVVTLTGANFTGTTSVTFGGTAGTSLTVNNANSITITTPAHAAGPVDVVVTSPAGTSTLTSGFTYVAAPTLGSVAPNVGPTGGGTSVTLTGTGLTTTTGVTFGGVAATNLTAVNDTTVTATTPANAAGTVNVVINTTGGSATLTGGYTYNLAPALSGVAPVSGPTTGGISVTLSGSNLTGTTGVTFGGTPATNVTVVNSTTVTATIPAHAAGAVDVTLTTGAGSSTLTGGFTYESAPTLTNILPTSGTSSGGTSVTLTGTNLIGTTNLTLGGVVATGITVVNATTVTAITPSHANGAVDVVITTPSGSATLTNGYTYNSSPALNSITPHIGNTTGGTSVTLSGTNFTGTTGVTLGGTAATNVTVVNDSTVTATTAAHAAGVVDVVITNSVGSATLTNSFTYASAPTFGSMTPNIGTVAGGTAVTLTGTNLTGTTGVTFGGVPATAVIVVNPTTVTAITPANAAGSVDVVITTPIASATLTNGYTYIAAPALNSLTPTIGPVAGGTTVTLSGSSLTDTTGITFGGVAATNVTVVNDTTVTATTPAHAAGAVDVAITTPAGTVTLPSGFTYQAAPTLASILPTSGTVAGGTMVTLTGTNLIGTSSVTFAGVAASNVVVMDGTTVTAMTPAHAAGTVNVVLTTPIGSSTLTNGYTYAVAPALTSLTPNIGPTTGGTTVTLTGTNLSDTSAVTFGGTPATNVIVVNPTTVTAVTAAHAAGLVDVAITNPIGTATLTNGFTYSVVPTLTSCQYTSADIFLCLGLNLNAFATPFIHVQGGLTCGLGVTVSQLLTSVLTATQLGGVTLPLLYSGCNISLCANSTCAGVESNTVVFAGLLPLAKTPLVNKMTLKSM